MVKGQRPPQSWPNGKTQYLRHAKYFSLAFFAVMNISLALTCKYIALRRAAVEFTTAHKQNGKTKGCSPICFDNHYRIKMLQTKVANLQEVSIFDSGSLLGTRSYEE
jgi:hypothetical protein